MTSTAAPRRTGLASLAGLLLLIALGVGAVQAIGAWTRDRLGDRVAAAARPGDILMIASTTCAYCAAARAWLDAHGVPFDECFIERDTACADRYRALLAPGTPVLVVRGRRLVGFDPQRLADALAPAALDPSSRSSPRPFSRPLQAVPS